MSSDSVLGFECAGLRMRPARLLHHLSNLLGHDLRHPQGRVDDFIYSVYQLIEEKQPPMVRCGNAGAQQHAFVAAMAAHVGLNPVKDIDWVISPTPPPIELFVEGKIDAFLGFPPEPQELRARKASGRGDRVSAPAAKLVRSSRCKSGPSKE
jgi:hypothetical protein